MSLFRLAYGLVRFTIKLTLVLAFAGAIALVVYTVFWLPDVTSLSDENPETTSFMERTRSRIRKEGLSLKVSQTWVPLDKISENLVEAVLVAEDDRFYQHKGFDLTEIRISLWENLRAGRWVRGGSTVTQQLAKNLYLSPNKTLKRKFDEMILTWKLESHLSKRRILELYLNVVEWGEGRFGAEAASQFYFSKPAKVLTRSEAASLAARLPNPDVLSSGSGEQLRRSRESTILSRMRNHSPREIPKVSRPMVVQKSQPPSQGPLVPQPATVLPGVSGQAAQVGDLFKDKVTQALNHLEKLSPIQVKDEAPEEPPRPVDEKMVQSGQLALVTSPQGPVKDGKPVPALKPPVGLDSPPAATSVLDSPKQRGTGSPDSAIPRPLPSRVSPPVERKKSAPARVTPPYSKRLRESISRLEQTLKK
jgi:monofunctional glycosyltransferase